MEKTYDVVVRVLFSTMVEIEANSEEEAIEKAIEQYDDGEIMPELRYSEYYAGLDEVIADESI
ncbi:DpnD/PcfM family protein [Cytobacillus gottheilii]|uniref:DpnD/PcfM family protein n=1 Tax=Cytobacillus gottheilii TaxID=859144 RepID=UPI0009BB7B6B|nr:DpnD/PcfM family protein [Cytobacillus gottheilii]